MRLEKHHGECYTALGLSLEGRDPSSIPHEDIKAAYRGLMNLYHPDKIAAMVLDQQFSGLDTAKLTKTYEAKAKEVNAAWDKLKDPNARAAYDRTYTKGILRRAVRKETAEEAFWRQEMDRAEAWLRAATRGGLFDPLPDMDALFDIKPLIDMIHAPIPGFLPQLPGIDIPDTRSLRERVSDWWQGRTFEVRTAELIMRERGELPPDGRIPPKIIKAVAEAKKKNWVGRRTLRPVYRETPPEPVAAHAESAEGMKISQLPTDSDVPIAKAARLPASEQALHAPTTPVAEVQAKIPAVPDAMLPSLPVSPEPAKAVEALPAPPPPPAPLPEVTQPAPEIPEPRLTPPAAAVPETPLVAKAVPPPPRQAAPKPPVAPHAPHVVAPEPVVPRAASAAAPVEQVVDAALPHGLQVKHGLLAAGVLLVGAAGYYAWRQRQENAPDTWAQRRAEEKAAPAPAPGQRVA